MHHQLQRRGIQPSQVTRIYCELEPCDVPFCRCARLLAHRYPHAEVSYSFPYGPTEADRNAGIETLQQALKEQGL